MTSKDSKSKSGSGQGAHSDKKPNPIQVQKFLKGIDYPADKETLLDSAKGNGADENVMDLLNQLPEQEYNSPNDVSEAIGKLE